MKYLKSINDFINEKVEAYPVRLVSGHDDILVKYEFDDDILLGKIHTESGEEIDIHKGPM